MKDKHVSLASPLWAETSWTASGGGGVADIEWPVYLFIIRLAFK